MAKILFQVTGSIAAYKAVYLLSRLRQAGHEVQVVTSKSALQFVGEATWAGIAGNEVLVDTFQKSRWMDHIHLTRWCDLSVICPASANTILKIANGSADDLISTLFLARPASCKYIIAPAMNTNMYNHADVQIALRRLKNDQVEVLNTAAGELACREYGDGRLLDPDEIYKKIQNHLQQTAGAISALRPKVLITLGGTRENLDGVRFLGNISTGATGVELARTLKSDFNVTVLGADYIEPLNEISSWRRFTTLNDLADLMESELTEHNYDFAIHLAAVSDFSVDHLEQDGHIITPDTKIKIQSDKDLTVYLRVNYKLFEQIPKWSKNSKLQVIGFKLTSTTSKEQQLDAVKKLLTTGIAQWIVHNDVNDITPNDKHRFEIYSKDQALKPTVSCESKLQLAHAIKQLLITASPPITR